ncbi:unnamed protein product [Chrysoparadoxa australica]
MWWWCFKKRTGLLLLTLGWVSLLATLSLPSSFQLHLPSDRQHPNGYLALDDDSKAYLAICLAFKADTQEQLEDLREWLMYYQGRGVERIYVMDNYEADSGIPALSTVSDLTSSGFVVYRHVPRLALNKFSLVSLFPWLLHRKNPQLEMYDMCLSEHKHQHRWMMFIDVDEFIAEPPSQTLTAILKEFEAADVGGLVINWQRMGSDNRVVRPVGGVLRSYTSCEPQLVNRHKTIVNTKYVTRALNPHFFAYVPGKYAVNIKSIRVDGFWSDPSGIDPENDLVLYHYQLKSLEDFHRKMAMGAADKSHKSMDFFYELHRSCVASCTRLSSL